MCPPPKPQVLQDPVSCLYRTGALTAERSQGVGCRWVAPKALYAVILTPAAALCFKNGPL